jgi:hypothetical protein
MTDTDITALIGRLRMYGPHNEGSAFRICDEAADALEALQAENERLRETLIEARNGLNGYPQSVYRDALMGEILSVLAGGKP